MLKIRLLQKGIKKKKTYIIVVSDSKYSRNGKFLKKIGFYDPIKKYLNLNINMFIYWKNIGAKINESVKKLYKIYIKNVFTEYNRKQRII